MPPKKAKKEKSPEVRSVDHIDTSTMSIEELQKYALSIAEELEKERKLRKHYHMEKNKLIRYWTITANEVRSANYELRDQLLPLETEQFRMNERMELARQEQKKKRYDDTSEIGTLLLERSQACGLEGEKDELKTHQMWKDLQEMKNILIDMSISLREAMTEITYNKQNRKEIIIRDSMKQRKFDLDRLKREHKKQRSQLFRNNATRFVEEAHLRYNILKKVRKSNSCALRKLVLSFDTVLSHNFERVSNLKATAEKYRRLDVMLTREYVTISRKFSRMVSIHADGMRLLHQMQTLLFAAAKAKENLDAKKEELSLIQLENDLLYLKADNLDQEIIQKEANVRELSLRASKARMVLTNMCRVDSAILSKQIDNALIKVYSQKVYLFNLLNKTDPKKEAVSDLIMQDKPLTYKTQNLNNLSELLEHFKVAYLSIVALHNRLFKLWKIDWKTFGIMPRGLFQKFAADENLPAKEEDHDLIDPRYYVSQRDLLSLTN